MKNKLVVWHNLNKNTFYVKAVHGYYCKYELGYVNQYNHKMYFYSSYAKQQVYFS